jgi:hypothetical protein
MRKALQRKVETSLTEATNDPINSVINDVSYAMSEIRGNVFNLSTAASDLKDILDTVLREQETDLSVLRLDRAYASATSKLAAAKKALGMEY